jgi:hypothetical protein
MISPEVSALKPLSGDGHRLDAAHNRRCVFPHRFSPSFCSPNRPNLTVVMIIRVYALFGRSRRVLWFMIGTAVCVVGVSVVRFQYSS